MLRTAQKMKFSIRDFFRKCEQIRSFMWVWSYLLKKFFMKNFIFSAVTELKNVQKLFFEKVKWSNEKEWLFWKKKWMH